MSLHNPIPHGTINNKVVTFYFSDATYTLKSFKQVGRKIIAYFSFDKDSSSTCEQPYKNSFSLDVFKPNGSISSVMFKQLN